VHSAVHPSFRKWLIIKGKQYRPMGRPMLPFGKSKKIATFA
jgi:hypothetical protein